MSRIEKLLKRFGYTKTPRSEVDEQRISAVDEANIDLDELPEMDGIWAVEGLGGLSSTRRPVDPRGHPEEMEERPK